MVRLSRIWILANRHSAEVGGFETPEMRSPSAHYQVAIPRGIQLRFPLKENTKLGWFLFPHVAIPRRVQLRFPQAASQWFGSGTRQMSQSPEGSSFDFHA